MCSAAATASPQTTQSHHDGPIAPNHLTEAQAPAKTDQIWAVDITYLQTGQGWLFLAVVLDLYSRRVVGWTFHPTLASELALAALRMALHQRHRPAGLLHHSDRGCQYTSSAYRNLLAQHGLVASMSRTGNPYDNAKMESFFSSLKTECLHHCAPASQAQAQAITFDYRSPLQPAPAPSALDYQSPVDFKNKTP